MALYKTILFCGLILAVGLGVKSRMLRRLTAKWQKLSLPLKGRDLSRIKTGFGWSLAGQGQPVTFYLDDIRYVAR